MERVATTHSHSIGSADSHLRAKIVLGSKTMSTEPTIPLRVLEFYSGIGGMHYALKESGVIFCVIGALDINTLANKVYKHNFTNTKLLQTNIEGMKADYLDKLNADMWTMSPPCQPYTRQGKQMASDDPRSRSFSTLLNNLLKMKCPPRYLFLENVKGFEVSDTRELLKSVLKSKGYYMQEVLVSPIDFGIPNSRLRYYMMAKLKPFRVKLNDEILNISECEKVLDGELYKYLKENIGKSCFKRTISEYIIEKEKTNQYLLTDEVLLRFHEILDIVNEYSTKSCCFTKAYGNYVQGTGSILTNVDMETVKFTYEKIRRLSDRNEKLANLRRLGLRYFSPEEVASLMCFPVGGLSFPPELTLKQRYRLLGNSICVLVVAKLMEWLLFVEDL